MATKKKKNVLTEELYEQKEFLFDKNPLVETMITLL